MKKFMGNVWYWKMAVARVFLYMLTVGIADFMTDTETWSQTTWDDTGVFLKVRLFMSNGAAMIIVLVAFLDSSIQMLRGGSGNTDVWTREEVK